MGREQVQMEQGLPMNPRVAERASKPATGLVKVAFAYYLDHKTRSISPREKAGMRGKAPVIFKLPNLQACLRNGHCPNAQRVAVTRAQRAFYTLLGRGALRMGTIRPDRSRYLKATPHHEPNRGARGGLSFWWQPFNHVLFGITRQRPGQARSGSGVQCAIGSGKFHPGLLPANRLPPRGHSSSNPVIQ
jgi:hypothetical protein